MNTTALCDFEIDVLRLIDGRPQTSIRGGGAGLGAALEPLENGGFIKREFDGEGVCYVITPKGLDALIEQEDG